MIKSHEPEALTVTGYKRGIGKIHLYLSCSSLRKGRGMQAGTFPVKDPSLEVCDTCYMRRFREGQRDTTSNGL